MVYRLLVDNMRNVNDAEAAAARAAPFSAQQHWHCDQKSKSTPPHHLRANSSSPTAAACAELCNLRICNEAFYDVYMYDMYLLSKPGKHDTKVCRREYYRWEQRT